MRFVKTFLFLSPTSNLTYSVIGATSLGCITTSVTSSVTVQPLPSVTAAVNPTVICVGETATLSAIGASNYSWNNGAATSTSAISPTITTVYSLVGTSSVGCTNTGTVSITVSPCTSINQFGKVNAVTRVYPNPTNGIFELEISNDASVRMMDLTGSTVYSNDLIKGNYKLDLTKYSNGIYFIQIRQNEQIQTIKLIKE